MRGPVRLDIPMSSNVICIAGAHRSGTSMLTRLLHRCGLDLGPESDLMPAAADNPDGFWENLRFVQLNDEFLNAVGAAWDLPPRQEETFDERQPRADPRQGEIVPARTFRTSRSGVGRIHETVSRCPSGERCCPASRRSSLSAIPWRWLIPCTSGTAPPTRSGCASGKFTIAACSRTPTRRAHYHPLPGFL